MQVHVSETTYDLTDEEVGQVEFKCRLICDRQGWNEHPIQYAMEEGILCGFSRMDMYWIDCQLEDCSLGALLVDPDPENVNIFTVRRNHNKVNGKQGQALCVRAAEWFKTQPEYQQQVKWMQAIQDGLYKPRGGYKGYSALCKEVRADFMAKKIEVCRKYNKEFAQLEELGKQERQQSIKALDTKLKEEGVYRNAFSIATFGHLEWVWNYHVKGKVA
jgi:hypothetical protein